MLTFNATQLAIVAATVKQVSWLFDVDLGNNGSIDYYWGLEAKTWATHPYVFKIINFTPPVLLKGSPEAGVLPSSRITISVSNQNNTLTPSTFEGAGIILRCIVAAGGSEAEIMAWGFKVRSASSTEQVLTLECEDWLAEYLEGDYPNTRLVSDLFPCLAMRSDNVCVPMAFGNPYFPLCWLIKHHTATFVDADTFTVAGDMTALFSANLSLSAHCGVDGDKGCYVLSSSYSGVTTVNLTVASPDLTSNLTTVSVDHYLLGPANKTYTIERAQMPKEVDFNQEYLPAIYTFKQDAVTGSDAVSYKVVRLLTKDVNNDGVQDSNLQFQNGNNYFDIPFRFSRDDLVDITNPAYILNYLLQTFGISSDNIDASSISAAGAIYTTNGLVLNIGLWFQQDREKLLSKLLTVGNAVCIVRNKVYLRVLTKVSKATITKDNIIAGSFQIQSRVTTRTHEDSGYVAWQDAVKPQDECNKNLIAVKSTTTKPSDTTIECEWVDGSAEAKKATKLALQRKILPDKEVTFKIFFKSCALEPGDIVTINDADLGGTYDIQIEEITYAKEGNLSFRCTKFSDTLNDWGDLTESDIVTYAADATGGYSHVYQGATDAVGNGANTITGTVLIGANGILATNRDPVTLGGFKATNTELTCYNTSGGIRFQSIYAGTNQGDVILGNYAGGQGAKWNQVTGLFDVAGGIAATYGNIAGWTIDSDEIKKIASNAGISLNSAVPAIIVTDANNYQRVVLGKIGAIYGLTVRDELNNIIININDTNKNISGWTVDGNKLYNTNSYISSASFIAFGNTPPTTYGNNPGVWLGWTAGGTAKAQLSLYTDANNYFQFDGSKVLVKSPYFEISSAGKLTCTEANVRGTLNADDITAGILTARTIQTKGARLTQAVGAGAATIYLNDTSDFPASGYGYIYDTAIDVFGYGGKTSTSLLDCTGLSAHSSGLAVGGEFKRFIISSNDNEAHFYGDRGDGTIEQLASIGIRSEGGDYIIGYFGSVDSTHIGVYSLSYDSWGIYGRSLYAQGIYGYSDNDVGGYFAGGDAPICLVPSGSSAVPTHEAYKGSIWIRSDCGVHLNTNGASVWREFVISSLKGTFTWDPEWIDYLGHGVCATGIIVDVSGVVFGDFVVVAPPYNIEGCICTARVYDTDKIHVQLLNVGGSAQNFASGTWKYKIIKY